ncbi:MAG: carbohydrate binding domain-containing protein [Sedimentisphaerales bacterium]|nr:carbohydrate binding domain-containing protein [Sedimentisphaerales bacterium]
MKRISVADFHDRGGVKNWPARTMIFSVAWLLFYLITSLHGAMPWLHVEGNQIKDPLGNVVVLRGISLIDLGFLEDWEGGAINMIDRLTDPCDTQGSSVGWYPRVIRIPIYPPENSSSWPYRFDAENDDFYDNLLRPVVDYCAAKNLYVIIDWHFIDDTYDHVEATSEFWEYMAPRFADDSHVIFELFNEPINRDGTETENWLSVRDDMQTWIDIVREYAPNTLILVAGPSWSQAIGPAATYPVSDPVGGNNIAMIAHIYPTHWVNNSWYVNQINTCAEVYPILMTEWGFSDSAEPDSVFYGGTITSYGEPLMEYMEDLQIGNTAWVASYEWGPPMFNTNWTLRCGEGEMGCFVKDTLYARRNDDQPADPALIPPAAPSGLTVLSTTQTVALNWSDNTEDDLDGYNVYRYALSEDGYTQLNSSLLTNSEYIDNTALNDTIYLYAATAVDMDANESAYSTKVLTMLNEDSLSLLSSEDFEEDPCDWTNVTGDSHNWIRSSGKTPIGESYGNTGPDGGADNSNGYVFFETALAYDGANELGDTAWLESPEIDGSNRVLTFYYHMYGNHIGSLHVDVYDGTWNNDIWSISGQQHTSQSDPYTQAIVDLTDFTRPIQIRLRAVAAGGYLGNIAIDDIEVYGLDESTDNPLTNPGFETGDTTGWLERSCSIAAVTSPVYSGNYSAQASGRTDTWQGIQQDIMSILSDGQTCTLSGWVRLDNVASDTLILSVQQTDDNGTHYYNLDSATGSNTAWTYLSGGFTLNINGTLTELYAYFEGPDPNVNFFVDDAVFALSENTMNYLTNPGFESGTTLDWNARGCSIEAVNSPTRNGNFSARVYNRTDYWHGLQRSIMGLMNEGDTRTISGWVRLENTASASVKLTVLQADDSGANFYTMDEIICTDDTWTYLAGGFTLNVTGTLEALSFYFESDTGVSFYVDDAQFLGPDINSIPEYYSDGQVSVNTGYQIIEGFGAAGAWYDSYLTAHPQKNEIYDFLFGQLGLDIYRLRNTYDKPSEDGYMDRASEIVTAAEESLGRPLKIMISSWSPPAELKSNNQVEEGTLKKDGSEYMYEEYADWWADSLDAWSNTYGIDADYINIQNEVNYTNPGWETCEFAPTQTKSLAGYDQAFEAVWQELNTRMGEAMPKMLAPETIGFGNAHYYIDAMIDLDHVYGYAHHFYSDNVDDVTPPFDYASAMQTFAETYGDKPLFQTEYEDAISAWPDALNLAILMHNTLTLEGASGYLYWDLFWGDSSGLITLDNPWDANPSFSINSDYYGFKHYSAFIHSGWQRVEAQANATDLLISAYISPDEDELSVVIINTGDDVYENEFTFAGFIVNSGDMYRTSQTENCSLIEDYDPNDPLVLPANSITTLDLSIALESETCYADAGPDQTVYASIDGYANVTLDGSCSTDPNETHTYNWTWTIDDVDYQATGEAAQIQLPVGEHTIDLQLKDGPYASEPDDCSVEVIAPLTLKLKTKPKSVNLKTLDKYTAVTATLKMPKGIGAANIDQTTPLTFYPGGLEADTLSIVDKGTGEKVKATITANFDISECIEQLEPNEKTPVRVVGKLTTGQYFDAVGTMKFKP